MRLYELVERVRVRGRARQIEPLGGGSKEANPDILRVWEDSRGVRPGDLFVARGGTKTDGAKFVAEAIEKGAVGILRGEAAGDRGQENVPVVIAGDVNLAGAVMAHEVAGNPTQGMKMIGVTGTKGKTTVAYLMRSVLRAAGFKVGMIGTVEIDDGVTVTPAEMTTPGVGELVELFSRMKANGVTHCVMEVSSHALHQRRVAGIDFAVAIFTNLTGDHLDYHKTMEEYAAAKAILFEGLGEGAVAVVNGDDPWAGRMVEKSKGKVVKYRVLAGLQNPKSIKVINLGFFKFGIGVRNFNESIKSGDWETRIVGMTSSQMRLGMEGQKTVVNLDTALIGRHNAANMTAVFAACLELSVELIVIQRVLSSASGAPGRLQRLEWNGNFQVFVDYAHTHDALENVLMALRTVMGKDNPSRDREGAVGVHAAHKPLPDGRGSDGAKLICVFGCGGDRDRTKRPKMGAVAERLADVVVVTSDNPRTENPGAIVEEICKGFSDGWKDKGKIFVEPDRRAAIRMAIGMAKAGDVVLLAGKGHENYQIIGTTKHHFDDVEEAEAALAKRFNEPRRYEDTKIK